MTLSAKKLQEVMKEKRRREKLPPRPVIAELTPLTLKPRELNQVTERCSTVLLAIETALVQSARDQSQVDDEIIKQALTCAIRYTSNEIEPVAFVASRLAATREQLSVSDEDWVLALRAICTSVTNHRKRNAGSFSYLTHARAFLLKANAIRK